MVDLTAYARFLASAPQAQREFRTLEIFHPDFVELLRFVQDNVDRDLPIEAGAPRDASTTQTFTAIAMKIKEPTENDEATPQLKIMLGAVGDEVNDQINQITGDGFLTPIQVIYRKYYSGDLSDPVLVYELSAGNLEFKGYTEVNFSAEDADFARKRSGELYTLERFPTLRGV